MTRYLLDTNHASAIWQEDAELQSRIAGTQDGDFSLCMPVVGELWFMIFNSSRVDRNFARMQIFLGRFEVYPFDHSSAMDYGRIRTELRRIGRPIPQIDAQIAAIARVNDLTLLTADRAHFHKIDGLKIENWLG